MRGVASVFVLALTRRVKLARVAIGCQSGSAVVQELDAPNGSGRTVATRERHPDILQLEGINLPSVEWWRVSPSGGSMGHVIIEQHRCNGLYALPGP